jgi:hypothetical protein
MTGVNWLSLVSLGLACWGALISTVLALRTIYIDRPRVKILNAWTRVQKVSNEPISHAYSVMVEAANVGQKDIDIEAIGFADDHHSRTIWSREPLPHAQPVITLPMTVKAKGSCVLPVYARVDSKPDYNWRYGFKAGGRIYLTRHSGKEQIIG